MNVFAFVIAVRPPADVCYHHFMAQYLFQVLHRLVPMLLRLQTDVLFWIQLEELKMLLCFTPHLC